MTTTTDTVQSGLVQTTTTGGTQGEIMMPALVTSSFSSDGRQEANALTVSQDDPLTRDVLVKSFTIASTNQTFVDLLKDGDHHYDFMHDWAINPMINNRLKGYQYFRGDFIVTAVMVVPGNCLGLYNFAGIPNSCFPEDPDPPIHRLDRESLTSAEASVQDASTFLNCELGNSGQLHFPFLSYQDYYDIRALISDDHYIPWGLQCFTFKAVESVQTTTPTTGTIQIFARLAPGYSFHNRVHYQSKVVQKFAHAKDFVDSHKGKGYSDMGKQAAGAIASVGNAIPMLKPYAMAASAGLAAVSDAAAWFGFTREAAPTKPEPFINRLAASLAAGDTPDTGEIVGYSVSNNISIDSSIADGTLEDQASYASLCARWHVAGRIDINNTSDPSTWFYRLPVNPAVFTRTVPQNDLVMSPAGMISLVHEYWRGDVEYCIYVVSSPWIQGQLQVYWDDTFLYPGTVPDITNTTTNTIIDLKGSSRTMFRVGYASSRPGLRTQLVNSNTLAGEEHANGYLRMKLLTPVSSAIAASVRVFVMVRGLNMHFWGTQSEILMGDFESVKLSNLRYQSGEDTTNDVNQEDIITFVPPSPSYPIVEVCAGEDIQSIRHLVQMFSFQGMYSAVPSGTGLVYAPLVLPGLLPPVDQSDFEKPSSPGNARFLRLGDVSPAVLPFTYGGFYGPMFVGVRGSVRVKVLPRTQQSTIRWVASRSRYIPDSTLPFPDNNGANPEIIMHESQAQAVNNAPEWSFPYYGWAKSISPVIAYDIGLPGTQEAFGDRSFMVMAPVTAPAATVLRADVYVAYGGDFGISRFRRTPTLKVFVPP